MPTTNIKITKAWTKVAEAGEEFLLTSHTSAKVEIASTATNTAPTVMGHTLQLGNAGESLVRSVIGTGYVWAKSVDTLGTVNLVVSK